MDVPVPQVMEGVRNASRSVVSPVVGVPVPQIWKKSSMW